GGGGGGGGGGGEEVGIGKEDPDLYGFHAPAPLLEAGQRHYSNAHSLQNTSSSSAPAPGFRSGTFTTSQGAPTSSSASHVSPLGVPVPSGAHTPSGGRTSSGNRTSSVGRSSSSGTPSVSSSGVSSTSVGRTPTNSSGGSGHGLQGSSLSLPYSHDSSGIVVDATDLSKRPTYLPESKPKKEEYLYATLRRPHRRDRAHQQQQQQEHKQSANTRLPEYYHYVDQFFLPSHHQETHTFPRSPRSGSGKKGSRQSGKTSSQHYATEENPDHIYRSVDKPRKHRNKSNSTGYTIAYKEGGSSKHRGTSDPLQAYEYPISNVVVSQQPPPEVLYRRSTNNGLVSGGKSFDSSANNDESSSKDSGCVDESVYGSVRRRGDGSKGGGGGGGGGEPVVPPGARSRSNSASSTNSKKKKGKRKKKGKEGSSGSESSGVGGSTSNGSGGGGGGGGGGGVPDRAGHSTSRESPEGGDDVVEAKNEAKDGTGRMNPQQWQQQHQQQQGQNHQHVHHDTYHSHAGTGYQRDPGMQAQMHHGGSNNIHSHSHHNHHLAPPLPRPPMPPQHYPNDPAPTHTPQHHHRVPHLPPPMPVHHVDPQHHNGWHNHHGGHGPSPHPHDHHGGHHDHTSLPPSSSRQPLVHQDTLHEGGKCRDCMTRVPYATLIATVMCCVGVGVFCGTMYRGTNLTLRMFDEVFKFRVKWDREYRVEPVQLTFMIVGAGMGGLGLMILFVGCLSTGDTRTRVYKTWRGRVGGRISCAIFMGITYILSLAWLLMLCALIIVTLLYTLAWLQCQHIPENECIDYNQFSFLFPSSTLEEDMRVCTGEKKQFCKDFVNNAEVMFILASVSAFLVILSLIHYLMCLAANYAHIKDQEKFMDLQEIQFLQESEMSTLPKDRF
ncbi:uncharacterized protein LOC143019506, partial [Oratosquilla oratoria]|uniref:uncharacterized protein LOC143019506 n=1 Tax=Oratosquilla oratoria TaxID=337810 RepID=UPI003F76BA2C